MLVIHGITLIVNVSLLLWGTYLSKLKFINSNINITTLVIIIYDLSFLVLFLFYYAPLSTRIAQGGYFYSILLLLTLLLLLFLLSVYWQESTRLYLVLKYMQQQVVTYNQKKIKSFKQTNAKLLTQTSISFEYYFITVTTILVFPTLIYVSNLLLTYIIFEVISLLLIIVLSFQTTAETIKSAVFYFFFSFYSTLFFLWGLTLVYSSYPTIFLNTTNQLQPALIPTTLEVHVGVLLIIVAFLIKLGLFPYHTWVIEVYTRVTNITHLLLISLVSFGYVFSLVNVLSQIWNITSYTQIWNTLLILLSLSAIGSTFVGALLLYSQPSIKGFFAGNSIVTNGFLLLTLLALFELPLLNNTYTLLWCLILYLLFYQTSIYILFNTWNALILWNWQNKYKIYIDIQKQTPWVYVLSLTKVVYSRIYVLTVRYRSWVIKDSKIRGHTSVQVGNPSLYFINFLFRSVRTSKALLSTRSIQKLLMRYTVSVLRLKKNNKIQTIKKFNILWKKKLFSFVISSLTNLFQAVTHKLQGVIKSQQIEGNKKFRNLKLNLKYHSLTKKYFNLNYLSTIQTFIVVFYQDYWFYTFSWVLLGFPPFILFIIKFYIIIYTVTAGLFIPIWFILLLTNIVVTGALCRILTLSTIKLSYKFYR